MRLFEKTFPITAETRILDVGGSGPIWQLTSNRPHITFLNLPSALAPSSAGQEQVAADGRLLPFADQSFDIVFSNSVIEHVGDIEKQAEFAREVQRVGRSYWVQTPNRHFPVELHLMLPLVHYLPRRLQRAVIYRFTGWERVVKPTPGERAFYLEHFLNDLHLLDRRTLATLFPSARIVRERLFGWTKSLVAVGRASRP
jgi:hypothetical protein